MKNKVFFSYPVNSLERGGIIVMDITFLIDNNIKIYKAKALKCRL